MSSVPRSATPAGGRAPRHALAVVIGLLVVPLVVALLLCGCKTCPICPECKPIVKAEVVDKGVPTECPAVKVDQPDLLLKPSHVPDSWITAGPAMEHDYRALASYYAVSWPQIVAQRKAGAKPAPTPPPR